MILKDPEVKLRYLQVKLNGLFHTFVWVYLVSDQDNDDDDEMIKNDDVVSKLP